MESNVLLDLTSLPGENDLRQMTVYVSLIDIVAMYQRRSSEGGTEIELRHGTRERIVVAESIDKVREKYVNACNRIHAAAGRGVNAAWVGDGPP
jgi:c-di-GMP-related signal transduction protein